MGRPTDEPKYTTLKIRLSEELKEELNSYAEDQGVTVSELLRTAIKGVMYPQNSQNEIANMCEWFNLTTDEFYSQVYELFLNGRITVSDGKVVLNEIK